MLAAVIAPTPADIGRRVVYDCRPVLPTVYRGRITEVSEAGDIKVLFDGFKMPLHVISNLEWMT